MKGNHSESSIVSLSGFNESLLVSLASVGASIYNFGKSSTSSCCATNPFKEISDSFYTLMKNPRPLG